MLHYAEKSNLSTWPEMMSAAEHRQCLSINFNIFNDKKYRDAWQLQQYVGKKYDFIMLINVSMRILHWRRVQPVTSSACQHGSSFSTDFS